MRKLFIVSFVVLLSCSEQQTDNNSEESQKLLSQKFFTSQNPGLWKGLELEHTPVTRMLSPGILQVKVPLEVNAGHYIEVIVLADGVGKELAVKKFERGQIAEAKFSFPPQKQAGIQIISKCNLHGMWPVVPNIDAGG